MIVFSPRRIMQEIKERESEELAKKKDRVRSTRLETVDIEAYFATHKVENKVEEEIKEDPKDINEKKKAGGIGGLFGKIRNRVGKRVSLVHQPPNEEPVETQEDIFEDVETSRYTIG